MRRLPIRARRVAFEPLEVRLVMSVPTPTGVEAVLVAPRAVVVEWNDVAGETGYVVERRVDGTTEPWARTGATGENVTRFAQDGLTPGRTYLYRVRATGGGEVSEPSNVDFVTTPAAPAVPPAPTGLNATLVAPRAVVVEWNDVAGETGYAVERRVDGTTEAWARVGTTGENVTRFTQDGLAAGRTYLYRVRALNAGGASEPSTVDFVTVAGETGVPAAPRLEVGLIGPRAVRLAWTNVAGETGYKIERRVDGSSDPFQQIATTARDVTTFTQDGLEPGKTYIYRVRATSEAGDSPYSNTAFATTPAEGTVPAAPRLEAALLNGNAARVAWTNVANETGYRLERRVDGSPEPFRVIRTFAADATTFSEDGLEAGKAYLYRVQAVNEAGASAYSNVGVVVVPGAGVPEAPRELVAEVVQGRFVRLRWADVSGETGYRIERRPDGSGSGEWVQVGNTAANVVTFADERVDRGRTYVYRVRAFNAAGNSPYSNVDAVTIPDDGGVPAAPRELNAELAGALRVRITWADVAGETGYKVERRVDGTADWVQIGTTAQNVVNFVDERVEAGKAYVYRVRAFNAAGNSAYSNTDAALIPREGAVPAAPRLEVGVAGPRAARLAWSNVAGETGYRIERRVDGSTEPFREIRTVGADVTTITEDGLEAGKTYLYRVRAFNAAGNSAYSNTGVATLPLEGVPTAPRELRATSVTASRVDLKWVDATGETGYRIERRIDGTSEWVKIGSADPNATSFSDTTVQPGRTYIYRVRASNKVGKSLPSNTVAVRTPGEGTEPAVPATPRLEAGLVAPRAARVAWTNVAGESGYRVERRVDGSSEAWREVRSVGAGVTSITEDGLDLGKTYLYRVRAFNAAGNSGYSNVGAVTTTGEVTRPAAPRELRATAVSATRIDLQWTGVAGETGYRIERRLDGTSTWEKVAFVGVDVTRFSDTKVLPGRTYIYRVRAGGTLDSSAWSNTASAKTPEAAAAFSTTRIVLSLED